MDGSDLPGPSKIVCVGRNYLKHAEELGNTVPEEPLLFLKPPSALIGDGETIVRPPESSQVEHEGEIGVVIGKRCRHVPETGALGYVAGLAALNDVTARDLQRKDSQWSRAKGFDTFCPVGPVVSVRSAADAAGVAGLDFAALEVTCAVNGEVRQRGRAADMAFPIPFLISYISGIMTLEPGDIIATGTPEGVGPLEAGDEVVVEVSAGGEVLSAVRNGVEDPAAEG